MRAELDRAVTAYGETSGGTASIYSSAQLLADDKSTYEIVEELFLATLMRFPTAAEKEAFAQYRGREKSRAAAFQDTLWALINTREFILNH